MSGLIDSHPTPSPELSAEQIEEWRRYIKKKAHATFTMDIDVLCDMALRSLHARADWISTLRGVAQFGALCFAEHRREMSELDGGWLHDKAKECGLIEGRLVTQEMWDGCGSVYCECDVGDTCYFPTETGKAGLELAKRARGMAGTTD